MRGVFVLFFAITSALAQKPTATPIVERAKDVVLNAPRPEYPESVRKQHKGGAGIFVLHVDVDTGIVSSVSVKQSTGVALLDRTCKVTFSRWRFKPHRVAPKVVIPITFTTTGAQY